MSGCKSPVGRDGFLLQPHVPAAEILGRHKSAGAWHDGVDAVPWQDAPATCATVFAVPAVDAAAFDTLVTRATLAWRDVAGAGVDRRAAER